MHFISIRDLRSKSGEIRRRLPKEKEMILTANGNPIAILVAVSRETLEESLNLFHRARAMLAVARLQKRSVDSGTDKMSLHEINREISMARKGRWHK